MRKIVEFENSLCNLIAETFRTREEVQMAIEYFGTSTITDFLEDLLNTMAEEKEEGSARYLNRFPPHLRFV